VSASASPPDSRRARVRAAGSAGGLAALAVALVPALAAEPPVQGEDASEEEVAERPLVVQDTLPRPLVVDVPLGLGELAALEPDPPEVIALGRRLFFDPRLSTDGRVACASCHRPEFGFADPRARSVGTRGQLTARNAPSLLNRALDPAFFWDGRAATLEEQVLMPIDDEREMGRGSAAVVRWLDGSDEYRPSFEAAFGGGPTEARLAGALAAFVRALRLGDSPVDRFRAGELDALDPAEESGLWIFESKGRCWRCHHGPNFADGEFHNTGVGARDGVPEDGRFAVTGDPADRGAFKTPGLRGLTATAPYMHDGSLATLEDVVEFYRRGGNPNDALSEELRPIELTDVEAANLVAFLRALSRRARPSAVDATPSDG